MNIQIINLAEKIDPKEYYDAQLIMAEDRAENDAEHEANIDRLIHLTKEIPVPFFVRGRVKRLEDVKKYLYAGAKKVILKPDEEEMYREAAARFGESRVSLGEPEIAEPAAAFSWEDFKLNSDGMIPVVVQDIHTDEVLMVAYMNREAYEATIATGHMTYYSRSRKELWEKGRTSGHFQFVRSLTLDCDNDTLLARVVQLGSACHTGSHSCFFQEVLPEEYPERNSAQVFEKVYDVIMDRKAHPKEGSYTNYLFDKGIDKILKKVGEEASEIIIAAKNPNPEEVIYEMSDFLYHAMVLMAEKGITWDQITEELAER